MGFWIYMFICNTIIPAMMVIFGRVMWKHPPKKINGVYGYRTKRSMKNMDTWNFAHEYCGKLWWRTGWIMLIFSVIIQLPFLKSGEDTIGVLGMILCIVQCAVLVLSIIPTQKALQRNFDDNGIRR